MLTKPLIQHFKFEKLLLLASAQTWISLKFPFGKNSNTTIISKPKR